MVKLNYSIVIDADKEKVWNTMLDDETYRIWTEVFSVGSHYAGDWKEGSNILFLAPDKNGSISGMVSRIRRNIPYEFVSIEHLGMVNSGQIDTTSDEVKGWAGAFENYTFNSISGKTELLIELDSNEDYKDMFDEMWPKALLKLKELAES